MVWSGQAVAIWLEAGVWASREERETLILLLLLVLNSLEHLTTSLTTQEKFNYIFSVSF